MLYYIILHQVVTKIQLVKSNLKAIHMLKHATGRLNCVSLYYKHCINLAPKFAFSMLILKYKNHFCLKKKGLMEKRRGAKISTKPLLIPPWPWIKTGPQQFVDCQTCKISSNYLTKPMTQIIPSSQPANQPTQVLLRIQT